MKIILVTGTPGTGKSKVLEELVDMKGLEVENIIIISTFAIENGCAKSHDKILNAQIINEKKLKKELIVFLRNKRNSTIVIETHSIFEFFDCIKSSIVRIFHLNCELTFLSKRLRERAYSDIKVRNNLDCEIFNVITEDLLKEFDASLIEFLDSNNIEDLQRNKNVIYKYIQTLE